MQETRAGELRIVITCASERTAHHTERARNFETGARQVCRKYLPIETGGLTAQDAKRGRKERKDFPLRPLRPRFASYAVIFLSPVSLTDSRASIARRADAQHRCCAHRRAQPVAR